MRFKKRELMGEEVKKYFSTSFKFFYYQSMNYFIFGDYKMVD